MTDFMFKFDFKINYLVSPLMLLGHYKVCYISLLLSTEVVPPAITVSF